MSVATRPGLFGFSRGACVCVCVCVDKTAATPPTTSASSDEPVTLDSYVWSVPFDNYAVGTFEDTGIVADSGVSSFTRSTASARPPQVFNLRDALTWTVYKDVYA